VVLYLEKTSRKEKRMMRSYDLFIAMTGKERLNLK
jgi:hypothetical protein